MYILYILRALFKIIKTYGIQNSFLQLDYDYAEDMYSVHISSYFGKLYL